MSEFIRNSCRHNNVFISFLTTSHAWALLCYDSSRKGLIGNPVKQPELPPQLSAASPGPIRITERPSHRRKFGKTSPGRRPASQETCYRVSRCVCGNGGFLGANDRFVRR